MKVMQMDLIYLDYNCFQRGFDNPLDIRIKMEALACQEIFNNAEKGKCRLVWSFMHEDETELCPFPDRQYEVMRLADICQVYVTTTTRKRDGRTRTGSSSMRSAVHPKR